MFVINLQAFVFDNANNDHEPLEMLDVPELDAKAHPGKQMTIRGLVRPDNNWCIESLDPLVGEFFTSCSTTCAAFRSSKETRRRSTTPTTSPVRDREGHAIRTVFVRRK